MHAKQIAKIKEIDELLTKEFFKVHYFKNKKSLTKIAKEQNLNRETVRKRFHRFNFKLRTHTEHCVFNPMSEEHKCKIREGIKKRKGYIPYNKKLLIKIICPICGNIFYRKEKYIKENVTNVCSVKCCTKLMNKKNLGKKRNKLVGLKIRNKLRTGKHVNCQICGKRKYYPIHKLERNEHFYCSQRCRHKDMSNLYIGENAHNWKNGGGTSKIKRIRNLKEYRKWRKECLIRDNYTCQKCGQYKGKLEVHHKNPLSNLFKTFSSIYKYKLRNIRKFKPFWNIQNGITVCLECHKKIDKYRSRICEK